VNSADDIGLWHRNGSWFSRRSLNLE